MNYKFITCKKQAIFRAAMVIVSFAVVIRVVKKQLHGDSNNGCQRGFKQPGDHSLEFCMILDYGHQLKLFWC